MRLLLLVFLIKLFGFLKGLLIFLFSIQTYDFILDKFFGLEILSPADFTFVAWEPERQYNLVFGLIFEGRNKNGVKKIFEERGIKFFKRLRQKLTFRLGNFYLKESSEEEALKQVQLIDDNLNSMEEFDEFRKKIASVPFDIDQFLFRVFIGENENNQSYMIVQFDHLLGDGMAINCLISHLTDDFDIKNFPLIAQKSKLLKFKNKVLAPFYSLAVVSMMYLNKTPMTPFKLVKPVSGEKTTAISQEYKFGKIRTAFKKLNVSFNDYFLAIVTAAAKRYSSDNHFDSANSLKCIIPMNMRESPKSENDLVMSNLSGGVGLNLPFIDDPVKEVQKISQVTKKYIKNQIYCEAVTFLNLFSNFFFPFFFSRQVICQASKNFDFVISNLPGSQTPLQMGGLLFKNIYTFPNSGPHGCFLACHTYMEKLSVCIVVDKSTNCNANDFIKYIEYQINASLENLKVE